MKDKNSIYVLCCTMSTKMSTPTLFAKCFIARRYLSRKLVKRVIKTLFILIMLVLNLLYVAGPLIEKYLESGIMFEESTVSHQNLLSPAVLIGRLGSDGW